MSLYSNPQFVNDSTPALSATNLNNLADCAEANQSYEISLTLASSDWSSSSPPTNTINYSSVSALINITSSTVGYCKLSDSATDSQKNAALLYGVYLSAIGTGYVTFSCNGTAPSVNIPYILVITSDGSLVP